MAKNGSKIKTTWDLSVFYKSPKDPQIEKDIEAIEKAYQDFAASYKNRKDYTEDDQKLLVALRDWEKLTVKASVWKPALYFHYIQDIDSQNQFVEAQMNKTVNRLTKAANEIVFFQLALGKIPNERRDEILKSELLRPFRYYLKTIFDTSKHDLSEAEEKILNLKSLPSYTLWVQGQEKLLTAQTVKHRGKVIPLTKASSMIAELPRGERKTLSAEILKVTKSVSHFGESEINAIITNKKIDDELRNFKEPYSATILSYQNDERAIMNLVETITNNFNISHRFFKLKAKLLKLKKLESYDQYAHIGKTSKKIPFEKGVELLRTVFAKIDQKYEQIFVTMLEKGQIDVYPTKGKRGGAYCSSSLGNPTFILSNYTDNLESVTTIAHEMGHAFHGHFSKTQPPLYESYTISTAEVASTLFENFLFDEIFQTLNKKEQIVALHDKILEDVSSVFAQIALFNFELDLHRRIRAEGSVSKEEMSRMMAGHFRKYLGPSVNIKDENVYMFIRWPHLRYFFYVYTYAYGTLISKALYSRLKKDPSYMQQIEKFLSAGGSDSPENIFKSIGVDTTKPEFFTEGLKSIEENIIRLEKLI